MHFHQDDKLPVPEGCGHWPGHITTGIIGGKYLFQALADAGHKDVALKILETTDYPGFGFMFSNKMEPATGNLRMPSGRFCVYSVVRYALLRSNAIFENEVPRDVREYVGTL